MGATVRPSHRYSHTQILSHTQPNHLPPPPLPVRCVQSNIVLLTQAFRKKFVIPDFPAFASHIDGLYDSAKKLDEGQVRWDP